MLKLETPGAKDNGTNALGKYMPQARLVTPVAYKSYV